MKKFKGKNKKRGLRWMQDKPSVEPKGYTVYDSAHIWHIAADIRDMNAKKGWVRAACGYYFEQVKRLPTWVTCKACSDAIRGKNTDALRSHVYRRTEVIPPKKKPLPDRIVEQRFEPPEAP